MEQDPRPRGFFDDFLWQMQHRKVKPRPRATRADIFIGVPFALLFAILGGAILANALVRGQIISAHDGLILRAQDPDGFWFQCLLPIFMIVAGLASAAGLVIRYRRRTAGRGSGT